MTIRKVNEHNIDLPDDMKVGSGGMWDQIEYKGVAIMTQESERAEEIYTGKFFIEEQSGYIECDTLEKARCEIDAGKGFKIQ